MLKEFFQLTIRLRLCIVIDEYIKTSKYLKKNNIKIVEIHIWKRCNTRSRNDQWESESPVSVSDSKIISEKKERKERRKMKRKRGREQRCNTHCDSLYKTRYRDNFAFENAYLSVYIANVRSFRNARKSYCNLLSTLFASGDCGAHVCTRETACPTFETTCQ